MKRACTKRIANAVSRGAIEEVHIHLKRRARINEVIVEKGGDPKG
jgi:hypothetical protein